MFGAAVMTAQDAARGGGPGGGQGRRWRSRRTRTGRAAVGDDHDGVRGRRRHPGKVTPARWAVVVARAEVDTGPMGTQSFVLLMHDPDVAYSAARSTSPTGSSGTSGHVDRLPEGVMPVAELPDGTRQVSLRAAGYMGPGAPARVRITTTRSSCSRSTRRSTSSRHAAGGRGTPAPR